MCEERVFAGISVELLDTMGDDLTVVNAARVSMDKHHTEFTLGDAALIEYLARNGHWSPFAHPQMSFRVRAPIFVARQLVKHQVGLSWNEVSRRYVDSDPVFYLPAARRRAETVKQGSLSETVPGAEDIISDAVVAARRAYNDLLQMGVAPEIARVVLPQSMMTEWVWTGSLYAFARVVNQRMDPHAQREAAEVAQGIRDHLVRAFPHSSAALLKNS